MSKREPLPSAEAIHAALSLREFERHLEDPSAYELEILPDGNLIQRPCRQAGLSSEVLALLERYGSSIGYTPLADRTVMVAGANPAAAARLDAWLHDEDIRVRLRSGSPAPAHQPRPSPRCSRHRSRAPGGGDDGDGGGDATPPSLTAPSCTAPRSAAGRRK